VALARVGYPRLAGDSGEPMSWRAPGSLRPPAVQSREPPGKVPRKTSGLGSGTVKGPSETATPPLGPVTEPVGRVAEGQPQTEPSGNRMELRRRSRRQPMSDRFGGAGPVNTSRDDPNGRTRLVTWRRRHLNVRTVGRRHRAGLSPRSGSGGDHRRCAVGAAGARGRTTPAVQRERWILRQHAGRRHRDRVQDAFRAAGRRMRRKVT
jgi:hypothetical protein